MYIFRGPKGEATRLKRLALLFDEIHYIRPSFAVILDEVLEANGKSSDPTSSIEIDPLRDIDSIRLLSFDTELEETLAALEDAGVAIDCSDAVLTSERSSAYRRWREPILADAMADPNWNELTETSEDAYSKPEIATLRLRKIDSEDTFTLTGINEPPALARADYLSASGFLAKTTDGYPIFDEQLRPLLAYKYEQYKEGLRTLRAAEGFESAVEHRARFGETAFAIANAVFSSDSLESRSVEDILRFRDEMDIARRELLSRDLMDLSLLVDENPWGPKAEEEVKKFVDGKLAGDVAAYDANSASTWERLYGALAVRATSIAQATSVGGGIGGVTGHILPQASFWGMLLGGLLVGASKEAPGVVKDLTDAYREDRERRRTGTRISPGFASSSSTLLSGAGITATGTQFLPTPFLS